MSICPTLFVAILTAIGTHLLSGKGYLAWASLSEHLPLPSSPVFLPPPSKSFPGPQGKIKGREEKRKKVACGTPFEPKRPNPHGYLATSLAVTCPRLGASYGLWDTLRTKINKSACDTLFCASQNASSESLAASCRPAGHADWDVAVAAQGLVHHMACGAPFEPKGTNPHGYLATRLAVTPYFALRKMFPGRV